MRLASITAALVLVVSARAALADDGAASDAPKSEYVATALSVVGSLAGPALLIGGISIGVRDCASCGTVGDGVFAAGVAATVVAPSAGSIYAGKLGTRGMAMRGAGVGMIAGAVTLAESSCTDGSACEPGAQLALAVVGAALVVGGSAYDIYDAHDNARAYNERHRVSATLAPMVARTPDGTRSGLAVVGTF